MTEKYKYLIGKTKLEVISILGQEYNFFPSDYWSYELNKTWWGKKVKLYLEFHQDLVKKIEIKIFYF